MKYTYKKMASGGRVDKDKGYTAKDRKGLERELNSWLSQYVVEEGQATAKAIALAERIAQNAPMSNFAVMHALPRIADQSQSEGLFTESLMAAVAESTPEAQSRLRAFLEGRAGKVVKTGA